MKKKTAADSRLDFSKMMNCALVAKDFLSNEFSFEYRLAHERNVENHVRAAQRIHTVLSIATTITVLSMSLAPSRNGLARAHYSLLHVYTQNGSARSVLRVVRYAGDGRRDDSSTRISFAALRDVIEEKNSMGRARLWR